MNPLSKLKSCPKCNSEELSYSHTVKIYAPERIITITCDKCNFKASVTSKEMRDVQPLIEQLNKLKQQIPMLIDHNAILDWNNRARKFIKSSQ